MHTFDQVKLLAHLLTVKQNHELALENMRAFSGRRAILKFHKDYDKLVEVWIMHDTTLLKTTFLLSC